MIQDNSATAQNRKSSSIATMFFCILSFLIGLLLLVGAGADHQLGLDKGVKLVLGQSLELQGTLLEGEALLVGVLGYLAGHVVADLGVKAGDKHKTARHN